MEIESALKEAEAKAKKSGITAALDQKFKSLNTTVSASHKQLSELVNAYTNTDLDSSAFDNFTHKLLNTSKSLRKIFEEFYTSDIDISSDSGDNLDHFITQIGDSLQTLDKRSLDIQKIFKRVNESIEAPPVEKSVESWTSIGTKIDDLFNSGKKIDKRTKEYLRPMEQILNLYDEYQRMGGTGTIVELANATTAGGINTSTSEALVKGLQKRRAKAASSEESAQTAEGTQQAADALTRTLTQQVFAFDSASDKAEQTTSSFSLLKNVTQELSKGMDILKARLTKAFSIDTIISNVKKLANIVITLDDSLTKMQMSTEESRSALERFQQKSLSTGKNIGASSQNIMAAAATFSKNGYSLETSGELSQSANIYARTGDMDISQSTEQILSSVKTWRNEFQNEVKASEAIIDRYTAVGSAYAVTSSEIGKAVEQSADVMKAGGNNLNESIGLITTGSLLYGSADAVTKTFDNMTSRIHSSSSTIRNDILSLTGVDIMLDDSSLKSTTSIILELGAAYQQLSAKDKSKLTDGLADSENVSTLQTLLENYEMLADVMDTVESSDGTALEKNDMYMASINGKMEEFQNQLQQLASVTLEDDFLKEVVELGTHLLEILTLIIDKLGAVPVILTAVAGALSFKDIGRVKMLPL